MLLGKRQRQVPIKRTTSLSEITFDLNDITAEGNCSEAVGAPCEPHQIRHRQQAAAAAAAATLFRGQQLDQRFLAAAMVSPRGHGRASADFLETPHFLRSCSLCKRRLVPGRDIYMYRGDSAFCSLECRQQQMNQDERKEKCSLASKKEVAAAASSTTAGPEVSTKGETVAAL